ncbi:MAG: hypothetical protein ABSF46_15030 [Terriglobia bacterium]
MEWPSRKLLEIMGYHGMVGLAYRFDKREGRCYLPGFQRGLTGQTGLFHMADSIIINTGHPFGLAARQVRCRRVAQRDRPPG